MKQLLKILLIAAAALASVDAGATRSKELNGKLTAFYPENVAVDSTGKAVPVPAIVVCPGGSYFWLDEQTEGADVGKWLAGEGIAAFVLRYRVAGVFRFISGIGAHRHPDMIEDLQKAIHHLRANAEELGVDPTKIGAMGFSAGGHLVMSSAEFFETDFNNFADGVSLRPDFVAPIYPVVSMSAECTHTRSRRALLGDARVYNKALRDSLSLENHVPADCPPVFLLNCVDDPIVEYHNSVLLDSALTARNIPHLYTQYREGGHGFGATKEKQGAETSRWQPLFLEWLGGWLK